LKTSKFWPRRLKPHLLGVGGSFKNDQNNHPGRFLESEVLGDFEDKV
jgi:hypothetical protein